MKCSPDLGVSASARLPMTYDGLILIGVWSDFAKRILPPPA